MNIHLYVITLKLIRFNFFNLQKKQYSCMLDEVALYAAEARKQMELLISDDWTTEQDDSFEQ